MINVKSDVNETENGETVETVNETKNCFFENINNIDINLTQNVQENEEGH